MLAPQANGNILQGNMTQLTRLVGTLSDRFNRVESATLYVRETFQTQSTRLLSNIADVVVAEFARFARLGRQVARREQEQEQRNEDSNHGGIAADAAGNQEEHGERQEQPNLPNANGNLDNQNAPSGIQEGNGNTNDDGNHSLQTGLSSIPVEVIRDHVMRFLNEMPQQEQLKWNAAADWNQSGKNAQVKSVLLSLMNGNSMHKISWLYEADIPTYLNPKDNGDFKACMELIEAAIENRQDSVNYSHHRRVLFFGPTEKQMDDYASLARAACYQLQQLAFSHMQSLDGNSHSRCKPTVLGLGRRYGTYCKNQNIERRWQGNNRAPVSSNSGQQMTLSSFFIGATSSVRNVISPVRGPGRRESD